jgi:mannose-1-phosphate guanylyltransferase
MRAVVLVGGFGTRLMPLTLHTPKQMLPVVHRPMIERVLAWLGSHGVDDVVLSLGYRPDVFTEAYPEGRCAGVSLHYAVEDEPLDTAGAIRFAARSAGIDDTFLVVNGDVITDRDLGALAELHRQRSAVATVALTPVDDPSRYGVVSTDDDGRVLAFVEKPLPGEAPSNEINAGTYVMEPEVLDLIPEGRRVSVEREVFPALAEGGRLFAHSSAAYWVDAGTPDTYLQVQHDVAGGEIGLGEPAVHPTAEVAPDAVVEHSVIGRDVRIGAGAVVMDSLVMADAAVGRRARVIGSILAAGATVGDEASLGNLCVVGEGEKIDPGAHLDAARVPDPDA